MSRFVALGFLMFAIVTGLGCRDSRPSAPATTAVKGKVTLDRKPMATGEVRFAVPGFPPATFAVKDGAFSGEASVGQNKVDVVLMKDMGFTTTVPKTPIQVNTVADRFSGPNTTLTADVKKGEANEFTFDVSSK